MKKPSLAPAVLCLLATFPGCATSYRQQVVGPTAFSFSLAPELCAHLAKERRTYRASGEVATYVAGAGAVLTTIFTFALHDSQGAQAATSGATLAASGVAIFSGSQVSSLEEELKEGGCR